MVGLPTQILVADLVFRKSGVPISNPDPIPFNLGAISLAMTDFIRSQPELASGNAPLFQVWQPILTAIADAPGPPPVPGILSNLNRVRDVLGRARKIADDAKSNFISSLEAKAELLGMLDDINSLNGISTSLQTQVTALASLPTKTLAAVAGLIPAHKSPPVSRWHPRELAHGSRTGKFFEALRRKARETGDPVLMSFAAGVGVAYACALAGNPFNNGVTGGPIRNDFWRHRWISHRVDTWVWGYYRTQADIRPGSDITFSLGNRVPTPPLPTWTNLCGADVQKYFEVGGISASAVLDSIAAGTPITPFLPPTIVDLWVDSINEVYPEGAPPGYDAMGIQSAYALTWLITWIQTSPEFLRAIPPDQINWPDNCGPRPSWAAPDGSIVVGGNSVPPPSPSAGSPSAAKLASAIAAALLALAEFLTGNIAAGIEALAAAAALADAGTPPNWDGLSCDLAWSDCYIIGLENAFRGLLVAAGLAPPYTVELQHNETLFQLTSFPTPSNAVIVPPDAAIVTCASPSKQETSNYPHGPWQPTTSNWTTYPTEPQETPGTTSWSSSITWPNAFVDGFSVTSAGGTPPTFTVTQINPVEIDPISGKPSIFDKDEWERRMTRAEDGGNPGFVPFGNAADLALTIIGSPRGSLLDWDLDGDRGIGWPTWVWPTASATSGSVKRE